MWEKAKELTAEIAECVSKQGPRKKDCEAAKKQVTKDVSAHPALLLSQVLCADQVTQELDGFKRMLAALEALLRDASDRAKGGGRPADKALLEEQLKSTTSRFLT